MEAQADRQGDAKRMLCTITIEVAAIIKEILQAGLHVDTKMRGEIILNA